MTELPHNNCECLSENTVDLLTDGGLDDTRRRRALAHLDTCEPCTQWVAQLIRSAPAPSLPLDADERRQTLEPMTVFAGRYVVGELIGRGGMGEVYAATEQQLQREVALKVLFAHDRSNRSVDRLIRESQAMARLSHPNVIPVFDAGGDAGLPYVAMELVNGPTVGVWSEGQPWREVLRVFSDIASGLSAAHSAGLVHRDIKPDNILVRADGRAMLGDFGLATVRPAAHAGTKAAQADANDGTAGAQTTTARTITGAQTTTAIAGTIAYMAPEQLRGFPADERSDVFSLCVSLYECLYRQLPYDAATTAAQLVAVESDRIRVPEHPTGPRSLLRLLRKGLASEKRQRFATAEQFARALSVVLRRRRVWAAATISTAISAVALVGWLRPGSQPDGCDTIDARIDAAWGPQRRERVSMSPAGAVLTETLQRYASSWTAEAQRSCDAASARKGTPAGHQFELTCLDRSLAGFSTFVSLVGGDGGDWESAFDGVAGLPAPRSCRIDADEAVIAPLPDDPEQRIQIEQLRVRLATAHAALLAGALAVAKDDIAQATQQARAIGYRPLEAEALQLGALEAFQDGDLAVAKKLYLEATNAAIVGHHDSVAVEAQVSLAMLAADAGDLAQAGEYVDRADATYESAAEANRVLAAALAGTRGRISLTAGDFAAAEQHYARALEVGSPDHPARSSFSDGLAGALQMQGRVEESIDVALQNLRYREESLGPKHPQVAVSTMNLGGVLFSLGRPLEALPYAERALSIASASMPKSAELARIHDLLGSIMCDLERYDEALAFHTQAAALLAQRVDPDDVLIGDNLWAQARVHAAKREVAKAIPLLRLAIENQAKVSATHLIAFQMSLDLADLLRDSGELQESKALLETAVVGISTAVGTDHYVVGIARSRLAATLLALGDVDGARAQIDAALEIFANAPGDPSQEADARELKTRIVNGGA